MFSNKNIKIFLNYWLGPLLFTWLSWSIYQLVRDQPDLARAWDQLLASVKGGEVFSLLLVFLFMILNWSLEALKWRDLLKGVHEISFGRALMATFAGVAFAVNTPNRIGEYGGRVLYLPEGKRIASVSLTMVGSFSQLLVTLWVGTIGLWLLSAGLADLALPDYWEANRLWIRLLCILTTIISLLLLLVYLRISWLVRLVERIPGMNRLGGFLTAVDHLPVRILLRVAGWSLVRYAVFVIQYILLLQSFGVTKDPWVAAWIVSVQFLVLAIIPTIALAELGIRGRLALELFGWISTNQLGIISAAVLLWLVNLVVPAIIGSLLILRIKIYARFG